MASLAPLRCAAAAGRLPGAAALTPGIIGSGPAQAMEAVRNGAAAGCGCCWGAVIRMPPARVSKAQLRANATGQAVAGSGCTATSASCSLCSGTERQFRSLDLHRWTGSISHIKDRHPATEIGTLPRR